MKSFKLILTSLVFAMLPIQPFILPSGKLTLVYNKSIKIMWQAVKKWVKYFSKNRTRNLIQSFVELSIKA